MNVIGDAFIDIKARTDNFDDDATRKLTTSLKKVMAGVGAAVAVDKIFDLGKGAFDAAIDSQKIGKQTEAVIKSTGMAAGISAQQIEDLATSLSKKNTVDDEAIQSGANLLLTFTNVRNGAGENEKIFDRTTQAAIDMSTAMGTDLSSSAMQLGKALNDPVDGLSKLSRAGVQFTDEQKEQIKVMQEAGDITGAQTIMLAELERQFGGSAAAQATATDALGISMTNLQEMIGAKLIPVVERFSAWMVSDGVPAIEQFIEGIKPVVDEWMPRLQRVIGFVVDHWEIFAGALLLLGGPITATVAAIALVVANLDTFQSTIDRVMNFVNEVLDAAQAFWRTWGDSITQIVMGAWTIIQGTIEGAMQVIQGVINTVLAIIRGDWSAAWDGILQVLTGVWTLISSTISGALQIISGIIGAAMAAISGLMDAAWAGIQAAASAAWNAILDLLQSVMSTIRNALTAAWNAIMDQIEAVPGRIMALGGAFLGAGLAIIEALADGLRTVVSKMSEMVGNIAGRLSSLPGEVAGIALNAGVQIIEQIGAGLRGIADKMAMVGSEIVTFLAGLPGRVYGEALSIGWAIMQAIVDGVGDVGGAIWNKISGGISAIPGKIGGIIGSINPFAEGGVIQLVPGYAKGTTMSTTGLAVVGERGPELVKFGSTSSVFPNNELEAALARALSGLHGGMGGGITINVMIESVSAGNANDVGRKVATSTATTLQAMGIGVSVRQVAGR